MFTVFMLHVKPIAFNVSFSPRETGQWKPDGNSAGRAKIRLYSRRGCWCLCVQRVLCSNRAACGWQLSLPGSPKRTFATIWILSWVKDLLSWSLACYHRNRARGNRLEETFGGHLAQPPAPASICDKNCCKLGGACSLPEHRCLLGRGDGSSRLDA